MAVKGETSWNPQGKAVKKFSFEALPAGDYELALDTSKAEVRKSQNPGSFPRVAVCFRALGTGQDGKKDRLVFHDFYIRTEPNDKGTVLVEMSGQILQFMQALGTLSNMPVTNVSGEAVLDPIQLLKWLKNRDGEVVKGRLKVEKDQNGENRNRIQFFIEAEEAAAEEEAEDVEEETTTEATDEEEQAEGDADEDEFEAAVKGKGKVAAKPIAKAVVKARR